MLGIQGVAKKAGLALAAAFSVKKIIDFGAQCIELGSDLAEVQNVVDVTFSRMSKQVDDFAKNAVTSFGLSETMAKRFTGTFGAMAKAFGFSEAAAYEMSTTLTGLAGDVASFYNISQDEAYTKLKSVFSGETETLKDLGVVMTQSALDAYAMANGFGKTTKAMSEMEKVALRYQFVQDRLSASAGDFTRTSDSWANQVRILKLQFDSLKAAIGQGLINVLTPVIKVINTIIGKLMSLANAFRSFTAMITGKKGSGGGASVAAAGMGAIADSAGSAESAMGSAGNAAKKAADKIKANFTTGIDELNILNPDSEESGSGSGGSGGGGGDYAADDFDMGSLDMSEVEEADDRFQGLLDRLKELRDIFMEGFKAGLGDVTLGPLMEAIEGIKKSLREIFTDPEVVDAFNRWLDTMAYSLGQTAGAMASVGSTIATNLMCGWDRYLDQNKELIKQRILNILDITGEIASIAGNFAQAFANIFSVSGKENGQRITAALIGIFANAFMGLNEIALKLVRDILDVITRPFIDNQDAFKVAIEGFQGVLASSLETIKGVVDDTMAKLGETYDAHVKPMFDALAEGFSSIVAILLEAYQGHIQPILVELAERIGSFADQYLQPMIDKAIDLIGKIADCVQALWSNIIQPFIEWFISTAIPAIVPALQAAIDVFFALGEAVSSIVSSILEILGGLIDFITGVFSADWTLAWEGIKEVFFGICELMKEIVAGAVGVIQSTVEFAWTMISSFTSIIWNGIQTLLSTVWSWLLSMACSIFNGLVNVVNTAWNATKTFTSTIWESIKTFLSTLWENVKLTAGTVFTSLKDTISTIWEALKEKTSSIWENIKEGLSTLWENTKSTAENTFNSLKDAVVNVWTALKGKTSEIWNGIWNAIKGVINNIIAGVENMVNRVVTGINTMISGINGLISKIPGVSGGSIPAMGDVSLPRLARGGFVRANTPQLAMIGDNLHQGEVVAPEDKLQEMVDKAVAMAPRNDNGMSEYYLEMMVELLRKIIELIEQMDLTVTIDVREIKKRLEDLDKRSGYKLRIT